MGGKAKANTIIASLNDALRSSLARGEELQEVLKSLFFGIRLDVESFTRSTIANANARGLLSLKEYLKFVKHHCNDVSSLATEDVLEEMFKLNAAIYVYTASDISRERIGNLFGYIFEGFKDGISSERKARISRFIDDLEELNVNRPKQSSRSKEVNEMFTKLVESQTKNVSR
ncbi:MAG: hypothetical protein U0R17_04615 [Acidimicrobiia bacterium]